MIRRFLRLGLVVAMICCFGQSIARVRINRFDLAMSDGMYVMPAVIYRDEYNIGFFGIEKLHPFDTKKYGKIADHLEKLFKRNLRSWQPLSKRLSDKQSVSYFYAPEMVSDKDLKLVHTEAYLASLYERSTVARIAEVPPLILLPNFLQQKKLLNAMRYATQGTIDGARLALERGWAINLSGGYHHAKADRGEGFCFFADIPIAIAKLRQEKPNLKVLIVDLDAHRGNGIESIIGMKHDDRTAIFDMYSRDNYPYTRGREEHIDFDYPMITNVTEQEYLACLRTNLPHAIETVKPDLIIYNAGSDIFEEDPLGKMRVTEDGIKMRDEFVFEQALSRRIPILMTLSGGYSPKSAHIVSASLENVLKRFDLIIHDRE